MRRISAIALVLLFIGYQPAYAKDFTPLECPVVGNTNSHIYHVPGGRNYAKMLRQNKGGDNRKCFKTEDEAKRGGYRRSQR